MAQVFRNQEYNCYKTENATSLLEFNKTLGIKMSLCIERKSMRTVCSC